jgi:DNA-binding transcriptional LysR family regulator
MPRLLREIHKNHNLMRSMNGFLATVPFDLYQLHLFHLVVKHRSFTRAAEIAGLTQSAITRQMQAMETALGVDLLERTTRSVRVSAAGEYLFAESVKLLGDVDSALQGLRQQFADARIFVRVGVSRSIGLAHLPGFFHANLRRQPEVGCRVACRDSGEIISALLANDLDLGVMCAPAKLPAALTVTHRFTDAFTLVVPATDDPAEIPVRGRALEKWVAEQSWLLISDATTTGQRLRRWMRKQHWQAEPAMELDSFDLIINLVSLGMGASFVPARALALYPGKKSLRRVALKNRFERELVVVSRRQRKTPEHIEKFIGNILF